LLPVFFAPVMAPLEHPASVKFLYFYTSCEYRYQTSLPGGAAEKFEITCRQTKKI
jgi:hypothetical protein